MDCTGRGTRTCSAGLLGLLLVTAVLLAIVLLDGQPAGAQAEPGSETGYGEPLGSDVGLEGDNLAAPVPLTGTETAQEAQDVAGEVLRELDEPLDTTVLAQLADARSVPDRSGGGVPQARAPTSRPTWRRWRSGSRRLASTAFPLLRTTRSPSRPLASVQPCLPPGRRLLATALKLASRWRRWWTLATGRLATGCWRSNPAASCLRSFAATLTVCLWSWPRRSMTPQISTAKQIFISLLR
jgi:hypothetical protein